MTAFPPLTEEKSGNRSVTAPYSSGNVATAVCPRTSTHRNPSRLYVNVTYLLFNLIPTHVHVFGAHF